MSLHLLKLFVGAETLHELATHQAQRLEERRRAKEAMELYHVTRNTPKGTVKLIHELII